MVSIRAARCARMGETRFRSHEGTLFLVRPAQSAGPWIAGVAQGEPVCVNPIVQLSFSPVLALRAAPTCTEALLWEALKGSRLVVEVDGGYHAERARSDARRDRELGRLGYRVVHVPAELVAHDIERVKQIVSAALAP